MLCILRRLALKWDMSQDMVICTSECFSGPVLQVAV